MQVGCCMCLHATTGFLCGFQDVYKGFSCIIRRAAAAADVLDETAPLVLQWNDVQSLIILFSWNVKYPHLTEGLKKKKNGKVYLTSCVFHKNKLHRNYNWGDWQVSQTIKLNCTTCHLLPLPALPPRPVINCPVLSMLLRYDWLLQYQKTFKSW